MVYATGCWLTNISMIEFSLNYIGIVYETARGKRFNFFVLWHLSV